MTALQLSNPFRDFEESIQSLWQPLRFEMVAPPPAIKVEVSENDESFQVKAQIPGVQKEDIKVRINGNTVSISAETRQKKEEKKEGKLLKSEFQYGMASRSFALDSEVDADRSAARYENGVLELTLPKKAGSATKSLAIK